jgi:short-subunit dehydrogenase
MEYYRGCTALITGASAGLGREFATQLAPDAGRLVLVARRLDRLEEVRAELMAEFPGIEIFTYAIDLADTAKIDDLVRWLKDNDIEVDFLVNNAGLGDYGPFESSNWRKVKQMLDVNIGALTKLTHSLLPMLRRDRSGAILNVGSVAGMVPIPHEAVYAATKAYVASFSEGLRAELLPSGVSVSYVCPGPVDTEFSQVAQRDEHGLMESPEFFKVPAEQVVHEALLGVAARKARVIPGWVVASIMCVAASVPLFVLRYFMNRLLERKEPAD